MPSAEAPSAETPSLIELFSRLPLEILSFILEQTAKGFHQRQDIAPLCLVSKAFCPRIQEELYQSTRLSYQRWDVDDDKEAVEEPTGLITDDATFLRTLTEAPDLGLHLRRLTIDLSFFEYTRQDAETIRPSLQIVLSACPNVTELDLEQHGDWDATADVVATILKLGRRLPLTELSIRSLEGRIFEFFAQLPSLRRLSLYDALGPVPPLPVFPFALTYLDIDTVDCPLFRALLVNSHSTVRSLRIHSDVLIDDELGRTLPDFVALRKLHIFVTTSCALYPHQVALRISLLPALEDLELNHGPGTSAHPLPTALLPHLPSTLQILNLQSINTHPSCIIQPFNHRNITPPPHLEVIRLGRDVWFALNEAGADEEQRVWWETAVECCQKVSVDLVIEKPWWL